MPPRDGAIRLNARVKEHLRSAWKAGVYCALGDGRRTTHRPSRIAPSTWTPGLRLSTTRRRAPRTGWPTARGGAAAFGPPGWPTSIYPGGLVRRVTAGRRLGPGGGPGAGVLGGDAARRRDARVTRVTVYFFLVFCYQPGHSDHLLYRCKRQPNSTTGPSLTVQWFNHHLTLS